MSSLLKRCAAGVAAAAMACSALVAVVTLAPSAVATTSCTSTPGTFSPAHAVFAGITVPVIPVGVTSTSHLAAPPLTTAGMHEFGWYDRGGVPGSGAGSVLFDAHSWFPNGTLRSTQAGLALGNALLLKLWKGGTMTLYNAARTRHVCYIVASRTQYAPSQVDMNELAWGHPGSQQLGIIVCSGTRYGPGAYTARTVWLGKPVLP